ncbi:MAG: hypothetical protein RL274_1002 [Pseudomonadota bacterium]|jgi:hypothetical protein
MDMIITVLEMNGRQLGKPLKVLAHDPVMLFDIAGPNQGSARLSQDEFSYPLKLRLKDLEMKAGLA